MSKKVDLDTDNTEPEVLDLDNLDDLFDDLGDDKKASGWERFTTTFMDSFKENFSPAKAVKGFMRTALPKGYSRLFRDYDDALYAGSDIIRNVEDKSYRELEQAAGTMLEYLPKLKGKISQDVYDKIEGKIKEKKDEYKSTRESRSSANGEEARKAAAEKVELETAMAEGGFGNAESTEGQLEFDTAKAKFDIRQQALRDKLDKVRFDALSRGLAITADSTSRLVNYNEQVNYKFQKKGLELQVRSHMVLRDIRRLGQANLELQTTAYNALIHNTSLTEDRKAESIIVPKYQKSRTAPGHRNSVSEHNYNFGRKVTDNIGRSINNVFAEAGNGPLDMGLLMMLADYIRNDPWGFAGQHAGKLANTALADHILPRVGREFKPLMTTASNRYLGGRHNSIDYYLSNVSPWLQEFSGKYHDNWFKDSLAEMISGIIPRFHLSDNVTNGTYGALDKPVSFNGMSQRSLVEIIPGYLARILQEQRMLRTGRDDVPREIYDVTKGKFASESVVRANIKKKAVAGTGANVSYALNEMLNDLDKEGKLSPEARHALAERLLRDAAHNKRFDPDRFSKGHGYADNTSDKVITELNELFASQYDYDSKGKMTGSVKNRELRNQHSKAFEYVRDVVEAPTQEIERLLSYGNIETLRDMGIVDDRYGYDRVNLDRLFEYYREGVTDYNANEYVSEKDKYQNTDIKREWENLKDRAKALETKLKKAPTKARAKARRARRKTLKGLDQFKAAAKTVKDDFNGSTFKSDVDALIADLYAKHGDKLPLDKIEAIKGYLTEQAENVKDRLEGPKAKVKADIDQYRAIMADDAERKRLAASIKDKVKDVVSDTSDKVLIKADQIRNNELVDVNTKRIIETIEDITGPVLNKAGEFVVTAEEAAAGLSTTTGEEILKAKPLDSAKAILDKIGMGHHMDQLKAKVQNRVMDVYTGDDPDTPKLYAKEMEAGHYTDAETGDPINTVDDIKGEVKDQDGNVVLSESSLNWGVFNVWGVPITLFKLGKWVAGKAGKIGMWVGKQVFKSGIRAGKVAYILGHYAKRIGVFGYKAIAELDGYLPGREEPVVKARDLNAGVYYNSKGKPIRTFSGVNGPVFDADGNMVVSDTDRRKLTNFDGTPHALAKDLGAINRGLRAVGRTLGNAPLKLAKWYGKRVISPYYGWLGKKIDRKYAEFRGIPYEEGGDEPVKEGSWREKLRKLKGDSQAKAEAKAKLKDEDRHDKELATDIADAIVKKSKSKGLLGGLFGDKEEDDDDDDSLLDKAEDLLDGDDDDGHHRRRRKGKPKGWRKWLKKGWKGLKTVGGIAGRGLLTVGGAMMTGTGALVTAGILATAAAGYGGYKLYQAKQATKGDLFNLRAMQYGYDGLFQQQKIAQLEQAIQSAVIKGDTPDIDLRQMDIPRVLEAMNIDGNDKTAVTMLGRWLANRFKPVYLAWLQAATRLAGKDISVPEIDSKVPQSSKFDLVTQVKQIPASVYKVLDNPLDPESPISVTPEAIDTEFARLLRLFKAPEKKVPPGGAKPIATPTAQTPAAPTTPNTDSSATKAPVGVMAANTSARMPLNSQTINLASSGALVAASSLKSGILSPLQAVRMRAYGLATVDRPNVQAILTLEDRFYAGLNFERDGSAEYTADVDTLLTDIAPMFGVVIDQPSDPRTVQFISWFNYRFAAVARAYFQAVQQVDGSLKPNTVDTRLTALGKLQVANAVMSASAEVDGNRKSVWEGPNFFNDVSGDALKRLAEADLEVLRQQAEKEKLSTPTVSANQQKGPLKSNPLVKPDTTPVAPPKSAVSDFFSGVKSKIGGAVESVKEFFGFGGGGASGSYTPGGTLGQQGNTYNSFAEGNGGVWEQIPMPTSNRSREGAMKTLEVIGQMTGVDPQLLATFISIESSFNYQAKAGTSSASGWGQFINSTWDMMLAKYGAKYGVPQDTPDRKLRMDPRINGLMLALFLKDNMQTLIKGLGRAPTDTDLYMAHFLGAGTAVKFLKADKNANAAQLLPDAARANRSIFYTPTNNPRTVGEVYALMDAKVAKHRMGGNNNGTKPAGDADPTKVLNDQAAAVAAADGIQGPEGLETKGSANGSMGSENVSQLAMSSVNPANTPNAAPVPVAAGGTPASPETQVATDGAPTGTPTPSGAPGSTAPTTTAASAPTPAEVTRQATGPDVVRMEATKQQWEMQKLVLDTQTEQLKVQVQMRDYLKVIAERITSNPAGDNPMGQTGTQAPGRQASNVKPPVSMKR